MYKHYGIRATVVGIVLCLLAGCVSQSAGDAGTSFHYQYWLPILIVLGGLACVPIGFFWRKSDWRLGWGLMTVVPLAACIMAPTLFLERVWVDNEGFEVHSGIFGMTASQSLKFDNVKSLRVAEEETGGRRSRRIEVLYFDLKTGGSERFPLNNDVKIESAKEIILRASARGVGLPLLP